MRYLTQFPSCKPWQRGCDRPMPRTRAPRRKIQVCRTNVARGGISRLSPDSNEINLRSNRSIHEGGCM